jgi:hypothetical protein
MIEFLLAVLVIDRIAWWSRELHVPITNWLERQSIHKQHLKDLEAKEGK